MKENSTLMVDFNTCDTAGVVCLEIPLTIKDAKSKRIEFVHGKSLYFSDGEIYVRGFMDKNAWHGGWGGVFNPEEVLDHT
jgi:hypothetical protein